MSHLKLNPAAVRERAKSIPGCKEVMAQGESVISFIVMDHSASQVGEKLSSSSIARVNIFVDSGTVGTSRVLDGKVRQSFRRNVQSLDVIERLLKHPEGPVQINDQLIGLTDDDDDTTPNKNTNTGNEDVMIQSRLSSPQTVQKELELADVGLCILQGEREKLEKHLQQLDEGGGSSISSLVATNKDESSPDNKNRSSAKSNHKKKKTATTKSSKRHRRPVQDTIASPMSETRSYTDDDDEYNEDATGSSDNESDSHSSDSSSSVSSRSSVGHGSEFHFKLPTDVMKQVDQCLRDINKMDKVVKIVATNGKGTVFLYGNGGVAYTPSIPKALYHKLRQLRSSSYASRPCFVALGTRDRYFVAFNDGTADWKGPNALDKILKKSLTSGRLPRSVAFGSTYDTFFVVFHDGSWQYQGRGIPETLEEKLSSRDDRADLVALNLGPSGEWFLKAENGRMWWSGITQELDGVLANILKKGYLHNMDFGENGSYFVSYDQD
jgi:hypothetical protein